MLVIIIIIIFRRPVVLLLLVSNIIQGSFCQRELEYFSVYRQFSVNLRWRRQRLKPPKAGFRFPHVFFMSGFL